MPKRPQRPCYVTRRRQGSVNILFRQTELATQQHSRAGRGRCRAHYAAHTTPARLLGPAPEICTGSISPIADALTSA